MLARDNNATHYESLIVMIRVLFKHGLSLSTLMERVMQDEQAGVGEWWCFLFQGVITNMLTEDPTSITHFKHLISLFVNILWFVMIMKLEAMKILSIKSVV